MLLIQTKVSKPAEEPAGPVEVIRAVLILHLITGLLSFANPAIAETTHKTIQLLVPPGIQRPAALELNNFVARLERLTEHEVIVDFSSRSLTYLKSVESGNFDLIIANAAISAWLKESGIAKPLVSQRLTPSYMTIVSHKNSDIYQLSDLAGRKVCTPALPSLFLSHLTHFINNPHREPVGISATDFQQRIRLLHSNQCEAILLKDKHFSDLVAKERQRLRIVYQSPLMPGFTLLVHSRHGEFFRTPLELWLLGPSTNDISAWLGNLSPDTKKVWKSARRMDTGQYLELVNGHSLPEIVK